MCCWRSVAVSEPNGMMPITFEVSPFQNMSSNELRFQRGRALHRKACCLASADLHTPEATGRQG